MKKSGNLIYILLIIVILAVNILPYGALPYNDMYYSDLLYLDLYNANGFIIGETTPEINMPLNTNHFILNLFKSLPGNAFPGAIVAVIYLLVLGFSLFTLIKQLGDYKKIGIIAILLVLCNKKYLAYLFTILPFGGIFTFLVSTIALLCAVAVNKKITLSKILIITAFALLFGLYNNATAMCAIVLGILIILTNKLAQNKLSKVTAIICGGLIIIISVAFAFYYKGVQYAEILKSGYENGIALYGGTPSSSFAGIFGFYFKNPGAAVKQVQSLLNNAFYYGTDAPFNIIDKVKAIIIPVNIWIFSGLIVAVIAYLVSIYKKYPLFSSIFIGAVVMMCEALKMYGFLYGIANLTVNLLLFNLIFDILIVSGIVGIYYITNQNKKEFKEKYGATQ